MVLTSNASLVSIIISKDSIATVNCDKLMLICKTVSSQGVLLWVVERGKSLDMRRRVGPAELYLIETVW